METSNAKMTFARYVNQPSQLPDDLREQVGRLWLYAYVDLNWRFELAEGWLILTATELIFAAREDSNWNLERVDVKQIGSAFEVSGLSCNRLTILNKSNDRTLMTVRYTHRQSRAVNLVRTAIEERTLARLVDPEKAYQEQVLSAIEEAQSSSSGRRTDVVWRLLGYLWPYRRQVSVGMFGAVMMTAVSLIPAYLTGYILDHVIKPFQTGALTHAVALSLSFELIGGLALVYMFREVFAWLRLKTMSQMGENVARDLREQVYTHLQTLGMSFFSSKQTGSLISRVSSDTDRIWDFIAFGVVEVTTSVLMLVGLSAVLIALDWRLGLIVTIPVPVFLWMIYRHGQRMQALFLKAWRKWSDLTDVLSDTIPGIRVVKAFNRGSYEVSRFKTRNDDTLTTFNSIHEVWTRFWPFLMLSIYVLVLLVWVIGVPRVLNQGLSAGVLVSFVLYMTMFVQPIEVIGQMARMVNRATSSAQRVFEVLDTEPALFDVRDAKHLDQVRGDIEFRNVTFSYDGVRRVLKNVSFHVKAGEMIGLVGPSGSGKSTIINLISRFYDVTSGQILVDGHDLREVSMESFRSQLGIVLQDPYLFHGSILQNIRYAQPEATYAEVIQASQAANAHEFICRLPHGYDTIVGERGHTLSGGERQRVSIARAILRDPRILILDEATSSVDTETERKIQEALDRLVAGRTVIAIAHRLSTLAEADRLLVIKHGELVEVGAHPELMEISGGVYRGLVEMQRELHH